MAKVDASKWKQSCPLGMRALKQWVAWKGDRKQPHKLGDRTGTARVNDTADWDTWENAAAFYERHQRTPKCGAGFVFKKGGGLVFIDFDHCLDEERRLLPWARGLVEPFLGKTYVEVSPSGRGLHVFLVGSLPKAAQEKSGKRLHVGDGAVEVYHDRRFSTVTGDVFQGSRALGAAQAQLDELLKTCGFKWDDEAREQDGVDESVETRLNVERALASLSPDVEYDRWVQVGMALKSGLGEAGLQLFDEWSRKGAKYRPGEPLEKWRSFTKDGVGLGTLFHIAAEESDFSLRTSAQEDFAAFKDEEILPSEAYEVGNNSQWRELGLHIFVSGTGKNQEVKVAEGKVNIGIYLRNHKRWKGQLRYNSRFERTETLDGTPLNQHELAAELEFFCSWRRSPKSYDIIEAVEAISKENTFDPVTDFLRALTWDKRERISTICKHLGLEDTPLTRRCFRRWLIGAVARAFRPGCEMQNMLVLWGAQGQRKGNVFKRLAVKPEWFSESEVDMRSKDGQLALLGPWIVENGELSGMSKADVDRVKGFISENISRFRKPYGREVQAHPRRCVLGGTTNETEFLRDSTGSRRFWLIEALMGAVLNVELLTPEYVEQLWAEARVAWEQGERWWDQGSELGELQAENEEHYEGYALDGYVAAVLKDLETAHITTVHEVQIRLADRFGPQAGRRDRDVAAAMKRAGWELVRLRIAGSEHQARMWRRLGGQASQADAAVARARAAQGEFEPVEG